jgi:hypothetical protein
MGPPVTQSTRAAQPKQDSCSGAAAVTGREQRRPVDPRGIRREKLDECAPKALGTES